MWPVGCALGLGLALFVLGWVLQQPGGQLLQETIVVAGIGAGFTAGAWITACFVPHRRGLWTFAVVSVAVTLAASYWTLELAMPATVAWTSASSTAHQALAAAAHRQRAPGRPPVPACTTVGTGGVGPIAAPYEVCPWPMAGGHFTVTFYGGSHRGPESLVFTDRGAAAAPDACVRHLAGTWWATASPGGTGNCPFGYRSEPGP